MLQPIFNPIVDYMLKGIYDDSASLLEFVAKLHSKLNEVIEELNIKLPDDFETAIYEKFREYTSSEMQAIIDSGEFAAVLDSMIVEFSPIKQEVIEARDGKSSLSERLNTLNDLFYDFKTEKFRYNNETDYYITEIPYTFKPKIGIANNQIGTRQGTIDFAMDVKASLAINAGISAEPPYPFGIVIQDGIIRQNLDLHLPDRGLLTIDASGTLGVVSSITANATTLLASGIQGALQGFHAIIKDGVYLGNSDTTVNPQQLIAQKPNGNYVILTCDGRTSRDKGLNMRECGDILLALGVTFAYRLDGGGSTSTVNKLVKQNKNIDKLSEDRKNVTFIYWAKDAPESSTFDALHEVSKLKQEVNERIVKIADIGKIPTYIPDANLIRGTGIYKTDESTINTPIVHPQGFILNLDSDDDTFANCVQLYFAKGMFYAYYREIASNGDVRTWFSLNNPAQASIYRPTVTPLGAMSFDTTLGKPIWWNGTNWIDATGTIV